MGHKKGGQGAGRNGRDSNPHYRGVKKYGGEYVIPGNIIIKQCGTKFRPGHNVGMGKDFTLYSLIEGFVRFESRHRVSVFITREKITQKTQEQKQV